MTARIGFIGLGIMGSRMAANLRRAGFEVTVWNRTRSTAEAWAAKHEAVVADTPADLARQSAVVITMVVDSDQVERVLLGPDGVAEGAAAGTLLVDMSTIGPEAAREIGRTLAARDLAFMDAPVSGSSPKAESGTLTIMAGGESREFERAKPLFDAIGELAIHVGPLGHGQMVKLINNAVAAANTAAVAEALVLGRAAGIDLDALVSVMSAGSAGSAMLELKAAPIREHDYSTLFKLAHMLKDVRLCLEQASALGVEFTAAEHARDLLETGVERGHADDDFAALAEVTQERSQTTV